MNNLFKYSIKHIDLVFFTGILMLKMYLFAKFVNITFIKDDLLLVSLGSVLVVGSLALLLPYIVRLFTLWSLNLIGSLIIFCDLVYFRYFSDFITVPVLTQIGQTSSLGDSIANLISFKDILFFLDLILLLPLIIFLKRKQVKIGYPLINAGLFLVIFSSSIFLINSPIHRYTEKYGTNLFVNSWSNVSVYGVVGHFGFHVYDVHKYLDEHVLNKKTFTKEEKQNIQSWFTENQTKLEQPTPFKGMAKGKNVMIIQLESFQNFVIGKSINGKEITPNLNKLKTDSMYFSNFNSQVNQGRTSDAEFLTNNSLYPLSSGSIYVRYPSNVYDSLPQIFKKEKYYTAAFHAYDKNFWNRNMMYQNYGFDKFVSKDEFKPGENVGAFKALGDEGVFIQMVNQLKGHQPFYGFTVALSSHHPYNDVPEKYRTLDVGQYQNTLFGNYLEAVHYVDYSVGELIKEMKKQGLWDKTVLVMYGDHDGGLGMTYNTEDGGEAKAMASFIQEDYNPMNMERVKNEVPLFIHIPNNQKNGEYKQTVGMIDTTPSLLHLFGIEEPHQYHMGNNIFNLQDHFIFFRSGSFTNGKIYYVGNKDGIFEHGGCYDIQTQQPIDVGTCKQPLQEQHNQLQLSDNVIYGNLLKEWKEKTTDN